MTVSHMFVDRKVINAEVNMETYRKEYEAEVAKGEDGQPDKVKVPEYKQTDELFMTLV